MYQNHFGLKEQAFSIAVNPRYLFMSQQHKEALAHLLYGIQEGGFVMLTGEVGTGKTTIIRCLLEQLPEKTEIAIILNPMANILELLCTVCDEFNIDYSQQEISIKNVTDKLHEYLLDNHRQGKTTVLLIDEAQLLSAEVLEQVRLLTNLETAEKKLLQIVLVGQPELNDLLAQPRLRQLSQRITARYHLTPLSLEETHDYIAHRLSIAGMSQDRNPFSPRIIKQIHRITGGVPRMINILCERALIGTYGHNKSQVDTHVFKLARKEVEGNIKSNAAASGQHPLAIFSMISASIIIGIGLIFLLLQKFPDSEAVATASPPLIEATPTPQPSATMALSAAAIAEPSDQLASSADQETSDTKHAAKNSAYDIENNIKAQEVLFRHLKFEINPETHPCWQINTVGHQCSSTRFSTWDELKQLNTPAVLTLITSNKFRSHVVLIGLNDKNALLLDKNSRRVTVALEELGPMWTGDVFYTWKKPKDFSEPLTLGKSSPVVSEIAAQFALIDSQPKPLTNKKFTPALQERLKLFQREHKLEADGIIGERTLMKLNEVLGLSLTLEKEF